jgi:hypothetical protein
MVRLLAGVTESLTISDESFVYGIAQIVCNRRRRDE